jgi:hypothetical protein
VYWNDSIKIEKGAKEETENFLILDPGSKRSRIPDPELHQSIFKPKIVSKLSEI